MKSLLILVALAGLSLPFGACQNKTVVEDKDAGRGGSTVRDETRVHEHNTGGTVIERDTERTRY